jgi:hypothetical protein
VVVVVDVVVVVGAAVVVVVVDVVVNPAMNVTPLTLIAVAPSVPTKYSI